jgi:hypothetical protein
MRKGDDLTTFIVPKVEKIRSLNLPDPQGPTQACSGKNVPFTRRGWLVNATPRMLYSRERDPEPILLEAGWASGPF